MHEIIQSLKQRIAALEKEQVQAKGMVEASTRALQEVAGALKEAQAFLRFVASLEAQRVAEAEQKAEADKAAKAALKKKKSTPKKSTNETTTPETQAELTQDAA